MRASQPAAVEHWRPFNAHTQVDERELAEECAIGISFDSVPYAVLMASPQDVADLALGFTISERIAQVEQVLDIRTALYPDGIVADILLSPEGARQAGARRRRNMEGRSSCGLCGIESPEDALRRLPVLSDGLTVSRKAVQRALADLENQQVLGAATRATHAAAWADIDGGLTLVREDVGRHNALDKVIGAAAKTGLAPGEAFIVVTSRCSYEMIEKTVLAGIGLLVGISAPTALAVRKATAANLTLVALARHDGHAVFTHPFRLSD
jgi:FdhD protein